MNRFGTADELVGPALFLASDAASFVTGHILAVDGGYVATNVWRPDSMTHPHRLPTKLRTTCWRAWLARTVGAPARRFPSLGAHPKIKDVICQALREWIVFGEATPGDRLVEADLAARFGVSKTPVREALLTLEGEGLVMLRPHRGAEVSRLSVDEWHDLIFMRDALEVGALEDAQARHQRNQ